MGTRVLVKGFPGSVRFIGTTQFATGKWIGVELDESSGKNDGSVQGVQYFQCSQNCGIFCRETQIELEAGAETTNKEAAAETTPATIPAKREKTTRQPRSARSSGGGTAESTSSATAKKKGVPMPSPKPTTMPPDNDNDDLKIDIGDVNLEDAVQMEDQSKSFAHQKRASLSEIIQRPIMMRTQTGMEADDERLVASRAVDGSHAEIEKLEDAVERLTKALDNALAREARAREIIASKKLEKVDGLRRQLVAGLAQAASAGSLTDLLSSEDPVAGQQYGKVRAPAAPPLPAPKEMEEWLNSASDRLRDRVEVHVRNTLEQELNQALIQPMTQLQDAAKRVRGLKPVAYNVLP